MKIPSVGGVTILVPNDEAFAKIPYEYASLNDAFTNNDTSYITNLIQYHILQGSKTASELTPGTPVFIPTLLTSSNFTNVTGGQRVENIKQGGDVVLVVSGKGTRSTVVETVSPPTRAVKIASSMSATDTQLGCGLIIFEPS